MHSAGEQHSVNELVWCIQCHKLICNSFGTQRDFGVVNRLYKVAKFRHRKPNSNTVQIFDDGLVLSIEPIFQISFRSSTAIILLNQKPGIYGNRIDVIIV